MRRTLCHLCVGWMAIGVVACGPADLAVPPELAGQQPFVTKTAPPLHQGLGPHDLITIQFSQPLDPMSVQPSSIVAYGAVAASLGTEAMQERWEQELHGDVALTTTLAPDAQALEVRAEAGFPVGRLAVVLTAALSSQAGLPFSQAPGLASRPYVLWFDVIATPAEAAVFPSATTNPDLVPLATSPTMGPLSGAAAGALPPAQDVLLPATLVISEVLYDVPGEDTNGVLFIELRGTPGATIGGVVVRCVNGDGGKVTDTIQLPETALIPDDGVYVIADGITGNLTATTVVNADIVANFDPQNGPDAIQLVSPDGVLLDVVGYGSPLPLHDADGLLMYEGTPATKVPAGQSLARDPDGHDTDQNVLDFTAQSNPSSGQ